MKQQLRQPWSLLLLFIAIFLYSCSEKGQLVTDDQFPTDSNYISVDASMQRAKEIGKIGFSKDGLSTKSDNLKLRGSKEVSSIKSIKSADGQDVFRIVNYNGGGFVILSADRRANPVLAYSETSTFRTDSVPVAVDSWLYDVKTEIEEIRQKNRPYTGQDQLTPFDKPYVKSKRTSNTTKALPPPDEPSCTDYFYEKGPLLQTTWDQSGGYNNTMPLLSCVPWYCNGRAFTGCVATAMSQIIRYHQFPSNWFNFSIMPNAVASTSDFSAGANEISSLMQLAASTTFSSYQCDGTGVSNLNDVVNSFENTFGYSTSATKADFDYQVVKNELSVNRPVLLTGFREKTGFIFHTYKGGHAWVADGYRESFICADPSTGIVGWGYLYFHMNWGWGGSHNGWFGFASADSGAGNYQYKREMVVNIHP